MTNPIRAALSQPEPAGQLPPDYIDPQHTGPDRELLQAFYAACQSEGGTADEVTLRGLHAAIAADRAQRQPVPPEPGEVEELAQPRSQAEMLAVRPMMEQIAAMGDCIGQQTVGQIMAISQRAAAWLAENPPWQPVAIEPRGCPTPGACSCVMPSTSTAHALPLPGEVEG